MTSSLSIRLLFVNPQDVVAGTKYISMILERAFGNRLSAFGHRTLIGVGCHIYLYPVVEMEWVNSPRADCRQPPFTASR